MNVISNTTPFISLASIGKLNLLKEIYKKIIIPEAVIEEIEQGGEIYVSNLRLSDWVHIIPNINGIDDNLLFQLDYGERQVIINAIKMENSIVLIDDKIARNIAEYLGIKVKGTLGVLVEAKKRLLIPSFKNDAEKMKSNGIRFSQRLIDEIAMNLKEI
jgi:uncharacterized protein